MKLAHKKQTNIYAGIKLVTTYFFTSWHPGTKLGVRKTKTWPGKRFVYTSISVPLNTPTCTKSIYLLPFHLFRGPSIFFSRDQNMNFFCLLNVKCCVKKVCRLHCRCIYRNVCPDCKHGESLTISGVGAWDHAPRWGKKAKNGIQIGKISASKARSRLPLGLLRSPIFFLFSPNEEPGPRLLWKRY